MVTRTADQLIKIQDIEKSKQTSIETVKVKFQKSDNLKSSFSVVGITIVVLLILIVISPDIFKILCYFKETFKKKPIGRSKNANKLMKQASNNFDYRYKTDFKEKIDKRVLEFELKMKF